MSTIRSIALLLAAVFAISFVSGCVIGPAIKGSGVSMAESRAVDAFTKLRLEGSPDVTVTVAGPGAKRDVVVTADDNIVPLIETEVSDGTLVITSRQRFSTRFGVKVAITVESMDAVSVAGSGNVTVSGAKTSKFTAQVSGSGDIKVAGDGESIDCQVTGSGDIDATNFNATNASASVTGSGDIAIRASGSVNASVTGSGDVQYVGDPKNVQRQVTGSGSVKAR